DVLEQLRLLSNLETTTSKLLQIVLVGQPELGEMLDSQELRQLGQRITLSCHLNPLSFKETKDYIRHRLHVASQKPGVKFTWPALRALHRYSGGIPRLINIACDRALLTAFGLDQKKVTGNIARGSIRELANRGDIKRIGLRQGRKGLLYALLLLVCLALIVFYRPGELNIGTLFRTAEKEVVPETKGKKTETEEPPKPVARQEKPREEETSPPPAPKEASAQKAAEPAPVDAADLGSLLGAMTGRSSRSPAIRAAVGSWVPDAGINPYLDGLDDDQVFFRLAAKQNGLLVYRHDGDWGLLEKLDLPAVLEFRLRGSQGPRYLTLRRIDEKGMTLTGAEKGEAVRVQPDQVRAHWAKVAFIPWKDFLDYPGVIPFNAPRESIITLKMLLQDIGFNDIEISPFYDERTRDAVKTVQQKHGIRVDGIVGPLTKMVLYKEKKALKIPSLVEEKIGRSEGGLTP
ncbi:MAG: peptidoglycan-binding protein, partial [Deltaproteobacteria bacterium]|nr:peptidoglycan-binding protein [Deltaproteobacteria bacterium]